VIGPYAENPKGERKWLCRCECGTEKYVLERSLLYGGSESCGCLRKERAARAVAYDLHGQVFGELTVLVPRRCQAETSVMTAFAACDTIGTPDPDADARIYVNGNASFGHMVIRYL